MEQAKVDLSRAPKASAEVLETISDLFQYHAWDAEQQEHGAEVRTALASAYSEIIDHVPPCPTRTRALNMLVDARMLANAAITHKGKY